MDAVCVLAVSQDDDQEYAAKESLKISIESIEHYCKRFKLALEVIEKPRYHFKDTKHYNMVVFEKNQVFDYLKKYDRVVRIDADIIINKHAPNIFDEIPTEFMGAVYEDIGKRRKKRREMIRLTQDVLGEVQWTKGYFNAGVVIASQTHKDAFCLTKDDIEAIEHKIFGGCMEEQNLFNWKIHKNKLNAKGISFKWNHMGMFDYRINHADIKVFKNDKKKSYFVHFAGIPIDEKDFYMKIYQEKVWKQM